MGDKRQADDLLASGSEGPIDLTDNDLDDAAGGTKAMANETYVNRVKTSDKQQKAVLDFVKG